jgi:hypothetical protein
LWLMVWGPCVQLMPLDIHKKEGFCGRIPERRLRKQTVGVVNRMEAVHVE